MVVVVHVEAIRGRFGGALARWRWWAGVLACVLLLAGPGICALSPADLREYAGRCRVLLVFAPRPDDPALVKQRAILDATAAGASARDLVVVPVVGGSERDARLRASFSAGTSFLAVLVGKDGGVKLRSGAPIPATQLFDTIDAMPMRQSEAAAHSAGCQTDGQ